MANHHPPWHEQDKERLAEIESRLLDPNISSMPLADVRWLWTLLREEQQKYDDKRRELADMIMAMAKLSDMASKAEADLEEARSKGGGRA